MIFVSKKFWILVIALALIAGCSPWKEIRSPDSAVILHGKFHMKAPVGWMKSGDESGGDIVLTREGRDLQAIALNLYKHDEAFQESGVVLEPGMLLSDLINCYLSELEKEQKDDFFEVAFREPVLVGGVEGFKVEAVGKSETGVTYKIISYGCLREEGFYEFAFAAPELYYFPRDVFAFELMMSSLKLEEL